MAITFQRLLTQLQRCAFIFDGTHLDEKERLLNSLATSEWKHYRQLHDYNELLLFLSAYPESESIFEASLRGFQRISYVLQKKGAKGQFRDSGLPFCALTTRFSLDLLCWLDKQTECSLQLDSFEEDSTDLNAILRMTLPPLERAETTAGLGNIELLDTLRIKQAERLRFILKQLSELEARDLIKDHLWESLKIWVHIIPLHPNFSRSFNRLQTHSIFYQNEMLKRFDHDALFNSALPKAVTLDEEHMKTMYAVINKSLLLLHRETDPATFMDRSTLRYFELERGISVAIYGMKAGRQLPLQSYIGYTLFKNGYPVAYGGSWIFGRVAMFGLNIFEAFRGGESGYIMCQLLRVYKQVFQLDAIEVEPYQYGLDNPDGIKSGAFWFYYRYGFRPVDTSLRELAMREQKKINDQPGYRSGENVLLRFTQSNIRLEWKKNRQKKLSEITTKVQRMIIQKFKGDRNKAIELCTQHLVQHFPPKTVLTSDHHYALQDMALIAVALKISDKAKIEKMLPLILVKPTDPYVYNELLSEWLA